MEATIEKTGLDRVIMSGAQVADGPPQEILIAPWGKVESTAGSFVFDEQAAAATIEAFEQHGVDLPVDYEHQTLGGVYSAPDGQAPAAGWIKALRAIPPGQAAEGRAPGLWAEVVWTEEAARKLSSRQYRYISPVALVRPGDRRVVGLHSAGLTNKPAIVGMRPLVNGHGADIAQRLRELLALDESATADLLLVAAAARIAELEQREARRAAVELVERAAVCGKLGGAQREWATALAMRDPAEFERWERTAPVLVVPGRMQQAQIEPPDARKSAARAEYHTHREFLRKICEEDAYVAYAG